MLSRYLNIRTDNLRVLVKNDHTDYWFALFRALRVRQEFIVIGIAINISVQVFRSREALFFERDAVFPRVEFPRSTLDTSQRRADVERGCVEGRVVPRSRASPESRWRCDVSLLCNRCRIPRKIGPLSAFAPDISSPLSSHCTVDDSSISSSHLRIPL